MIPRQKIVDKIELGFAHLTNGPINPASKIFYNDTIKAYKYDLQRALDLLKQAGYRADSDGILYNSESNDGFVLNILYRDNVVFENIALIFKESAKDIGINVSLTKLESRIARNKLRNHDFELTVGAFTGSPFSLNFEALFGSASARNNGPNYTGFGDHSSDSIIHVANSATNKFIKKQALFELQSRIHSDATMIFLYFAQNKIAVNKKFDESSLMISSIKPGYDVTSFKLKEDYNNN